MEGKKKIFYSYSLYHPSQAVRAALVAKGIYVYDMRSSSIGDEIAVEPLVRVDYWGSFAANFEIADWDEVKPSQIIFNKDKWIKRHGIEEVFADARVEKMIRDAMKA